MPTTCDIYFQNNRKGIFSPGQKLLITVRLKLTEELKYRTIYIRIQGTTRVRFTKDDCNRNGNFIANEDILDVQKHLFNEYGGTNILPHGTYDCSFEYTLPCNLPSSLSCELKTARIKYTATVVLNIPVWPDKTFEKEFTVLKQLDLNENPSLKNPVTAQIEEMVYPRQRSILGPVIQSGLVSIIARVPFGGYTLGQTINFEIEVNNRTLHPFRLFRIFLVRKIFATKSPNSKHYITTYKPVAKAFPWKLNIEKSTHKTIPMEICVPKTIPPTDIEANKIVQVSYFILILGWMYSSVRRESFELKLPITIGSMPLHDITTNETPNPRMRMNPSAPPISAASSSMSLVSLLQNEPWISCLIDPSAPALPDDDKVTIRTYTSTPPPFPDDELDLPTYGEAVDQEIELDDIEYSFSQLFK